jgi:ethanolamine ammonia-lyase large subunit
MKRQELLKIFVLANEFKEGDLLVGGTEDERLREEARQSLYALHLGEITGTAFVEDGISEHLSRSLDSRLAQEISHLTVADLKRILLGADCANWVKRYRAGLASEVIAAVAKVMSNSELSEVAKKLYNPLPGKGVAIGSNRHFGSRIQPNSPGDDEEEILFSILEGLSYGCGDVILGLNPASDDVETIIRLEELLRRVVERLELPTRYCVLSDIVKQTTARARGKVDVGFQSLAGTSRAISGMVGLNMDGLLDLARGFDGLYFETGQGSAVTNNVAEGVDMVTLESRAYGVARYIRQSTGAWMIVNDVAGFIGPEVFRSGDQLLRACLEDTVMAKLHGITMGLDVCSTFHMGIEPTELQRLTEQIVEQAAPAYLMSVAGNADPMLGYLTTSFREHPRLRRRTKRQISTAMKERLVELGLLDRDGDMAELSTGAEHLYSIYLKKGGDMRSSETLREEGSRKIVALRERGFDLGYGHTEALEAPPQVEARMKALYSHARQALYATIDEKVIRDVSQHRIWVRTMSLDREDYLAHPPTGEKICDEDAEKIRRLYPARRPNIQIVLSDGLNANALNENLRSIIQPLRQRLAGIGYHAGEIDIVVKNGRVRAGYHIGELLDVDVVLHFIGERAGSGINTLSSYLTYGRDSAGRSRWDPGLDHSCTTAICGIHRQGKRPEAAVEEIVRCVKRMFEERRSGVTLGG